LLFFYKEGAVAGVRKAHVKEISITIIYIKNRAFVKEVTAAVNYRHCQVRKDKRERAGKGAGEAQKLECPAILFSAGTFINPDGDAEGRRSRGSGERRRAKDSSVLSRN
jgi:hypothetical protein